MKAITLTQPWASLIAIGAKHFETRSWQTSYEGPLAIHAAAGLAPVEGAAGLCQFYWREPFHSALAEAGYTADLDRVLPRGSVVATCNLTGCVHAVDVGSMLNVAILNSDHEGRASAELAFGDYSPGRWAFVLEDVMALDEPVACRGALGLWDVPAEVEAQLPVGTRA